MMEQPKNSKEDNNGDDKKSVSPSKDPTRSEPNPKHENGTLTTGDNADTTSNITIDIDLNGRNGSEEEKKNKSPPEGSKSKKSVRWSQELVTESPVPRDFERGTSNPYVNYSAAPSTNASSFNFKETMGSVKNVLGRWGQKVGEVTRKAEDLAGSTWQHLKTNPSLADAALGRIAQGTKVLAEGGYEKIFFQTFETVPEEKLKNSFACYLSTSAGPVMGVMYVSTAKMAFCSDNPLSYPAGDKTEWSYYKVVIPLHQLKAVNSSTSRTNSAEKYIQVISVDNHEFWYMGFLNYGGAVTCLQEALQARDIQSV